MRGHSHNVMCKRCQNNQDNDGHRLLAYGKTTNRSLVIHVSDTSYGDKHIAQICSQCGLHVPAHAQLNRFYLASVPGITCMTSHLRPSCFSAYNNEKLGVAWGRG